MRPLLLSLTTLLLAAPAGWAKLEIQNVQAAYGFRGPERKELVYFTQSFDYVCFRFSVTGAQPDKDGQVRLDIGYQLSDAAGKVILAQTESQPPSAYGAESVFCSVDFDLPPALPPGAYRCRVTATDPLSKASASFERGLTARAPHFDLAHVELYHDEALKRPAGTTISVFEDLFAVVSIAGLSGSAPKPLEATARMEIVDRADGRTVFTRDWRAPLPAAPDVPAAGPAGFTVAANIKGAPRAGHFVLRLTVRVAHVDRVVRADIPFTVVDP